MNTTLRSIVVGLILGTVAGMVTLALVQIINDPVFLSECRHLTRWLVSGWWGWVALAIMIILTVATSATGWMPVFKRAGMVLCALTAICMLFGLTASGSYPDCRTLTNQPINGELMGTSNPISCLP